MIGARIACAAALLLAAPLLAACDGSVDPPGDGGADAGRVAGGCTLDVVSDGAVAAEERGGCAWTIESSGPRVVQIASSVGPIVVDGAPAPGLGPSRLDGRLELGAPDGAEVRVTDLGDPAPAIERDRSLTWVDATLLDDPAFAGLGRLMGTIAQDGHGGALLDAWFRRFATTAHSERLGPQRLVEAAATEQGSDPGAWDLDALPFRVTGIHNRIDLADGSHCGELRVSLASIDPILQPFHLIFLFRQVPAEADRGYDGEVHCAATALRWARLSGVDQAAFRAEARALLDEAMTADRFLAAETVEFLISPWEWRQWFLGPTGFENRPLFQTVDTERLNRPGADRDAFLAWVRDNAAAIDARRAEIPQAFRSPSARVNDGVPWIPLDLSGLDPAVTAAYPELRQNLEIVGCPACHATDADFVQTLPDRTFSPFYDAELDSRADHLLARTEGRAELAPFGPLQPDPVLPP